ncbi:MAG: acriflavine resistance protein B [Gemmatales bacterium]|nr:MAG: acriflavine resistance protein B [Gemmatales bacterium]
MGLIELCVRNPVKISVGVLLIALFGSIALFGMPMQLTPEVQTPTITVETTWNGASPQEIEREIIYEQETHLKSVEGVVKMTSEAMHSRGRITLEFAIGTDLRDAMLRVNTHLQQVREYPIDADKPVIESSNLSDRAIAWFILSPRPPTLAEIDAFAEKHPELTEVLEPIRRAPNFGVAGLRLREAAEKYPALRELLPPEMDVTKLRKFAEDVIEAELERVDGVADAEVRGGREVEMQVIVNPHRLAARRITIEDVRRALDVENKNISGGDFWEGKRRWVVRTLGQFETAEQVANTVIKHENGEPVYVRDVAQVVRGFKKPDGLVRRFGTERLAISVLRKNNANVLEVMEGLRAANKRLNEGILAQKNLTLSQVYDETEYIYSAIGLVTNNILVGGLLTVIVLLLFLRSGRSTLVIGLAIPTSIIGTFLMLYLMGRSLNVISLAGLAFAVGMLVDNAVVVLENIYRHYQLGKSPLQAAVVGTYEVWGAVLASTLTTLAVFIPVLFVQEEAGQLFRDIALAISCGIALSLLVSITVIPTAAARLVGGQQSFGFEGAGRIRATKRSVFGTFLLAPFNWIGQSFVDVIIRINVRLQRSVFLRLATVLGFVGVSLGLIWLLMPKVEYLPSGNRNLVLGILLPPAGYNLDQSLAIGAQIEEELRPYWDVDEGTLSVGDYPAIGDYFFVARDRNLFLGLRCADPARASELIPLVRQVVGKIPGTFVLAKQSSLFERGMGAGRTVDVEITGPDLKKLVALGTEVIGKVGQILPGAQAIPRPSLDLSSPEMHLIPKPEYCAEMQIAASELGYAVDALVDGAYAADFFEKGDKIDLRIIGQEQFARRTQDLEALPIATRTGSLVPLKALADIQMGAGPEQVNRRERQRAITIQVSPPENVPLEEAMDLIQTHIAKPIMERGDLEGGLYQINLAGTADKLRATWYALRWNFLLALLITYLLMAALFESWLYPFVIIVSVPLGAVGGFIGLWLLNIFVLQSLDVLTMLGFVILIGTVVNNPILIVKQTLVHMEEGMPMREAVLESVRNRIRPIFMTTATTVFGLLPLVLFPGAGSELYRGLGAVVLGGLLVSTLVTVILVPALFTLMMEWKMSLAAKWQRKRADQHAVDLVTAGQGPAPASPVA